MTQEEIDKANNYICSYMGGADYVIDKHYPKRKADSIGLKDLKFNSSWDWLIPVWKKIRFELSPTMVIFAINCIDDDNKEELHVLISNICKQIYERK